MSTAELVTARNLHGIHIMHEEELRKIAKHARKVAEQIQQDGPVDQFQSTVLASSCGGSCRMPSYKRLKGN